MKKISKLSKKCIHHFCNKYSLLLNNISIENNPHISLSKPFVLRSHQIFPFIESLGKEISSITSKLVEILFNLKFIFILYINLININLL